MDEVDDVWPGGGLHDIQERDNVAVVCGHIRFEYLNDDERASGGNHWWRCVELEKRNHSHGETGRGVMGDCAGCLGHDRLGRMVVMGMTHGDGFGGEEEHRTNIQKMGVQMSHIA